MVFLFKRSPFILILILASHSCLILATFSLTWNWFSYLFEFYFCAIYYRHSDVLRFQIAINDIGNSSRILLPKLFYCDNNVLNIPSHIGALPTYLTGLEAKKISLKLQKPLLTIGWNSSVCAMQVKESCKARVKLFKHLHDIWY